MSSPLKDCRILYVTTVWTGLHEALFEGTLKPKGMPAFLRPLQALVDGGALVALLLVAQGQPHHLRVQLEWLKKVPVVGFLDWKRGSLSRLTNPLNLYNLVRRILHEHPFDLVYVHGPSLATAVGAARSRGVPVGHRIYGTMFLRPLLRHGLWGAALRQPLEYLTYRQKKSFLLATDDGSGADRVQQKVRPGSAAFYYWHNGVDRVPETSVQAPTEFAPGQEGRPFLAYVARLDYWKRQDIALELIAELQRRGLIVHLLVAGQTHVPDWLEELRLRSHTLGISHLVHFLGVVDSAQRTWLFREAVASLSFYDVSNLGNVFHEMLAAGAVVLAKNDGSLNKFLVDGENGFLVDNVEQAAERVAGLLSHPDRGSVLRKNARDSSSRLMLSWSDRVDRELGLIHDAIEGKC